MIDELAGYHKWLYAIGFKLLALKPVMLNRKIIGYFKGRILFVPTYPFETSKNAHPTTSIEKRASNIEIYFFKN
jgi:hypothetical protein